MSTAEAKQLSTYKILARGAQSATWTEVGEAAGHGMESALKTYLAGRDDDQQPAGVFVAVPLRSWHPRTVRHETRVISKLVAT